MSGKGGPSVTAGVQGTHPATTGSRFEGGSAAFAAFGPNPTTFKRDVYR